MSRNGSGTYTVPNTFTPSTTISSSAMNANFTDVSNELTNSLALDGQSSMTGQIKAADGSVSAPGLGFASDTNTGFRRSASGTVKFVADGVDAVTFGSAGVSGNIVGSLTGNVVGDVTGNVTGTVTGTGAFTTVSASVSATIANLTYTGTLTGGNSVINIGSGQIYKAASGKVGIGTTSPGQQLTVVGTVESTSGGFKFPDGTTQTTKANDDPGFVSSQVWTDVTSSRAYGGTYTNSTSRPIFVAVVNNGVGSLSVTINGSTVALIGYINISFIVPPGQTYSVTTSGGSLSRWAELR